MAPAIDVEAPRFAVSAAARLAGMHPQTLRTYDRLGIVVPQRTGGGGRRYSVRDIERLQEVQQLSGEEGINLAGIKHIFALKDENRRLRAQVEFLKALADPGGRVFTATTDGAVEAVSSVRRSRGMVREARALVRWRPWS